MLQQSPGFVPSPRDGERNLLKTLVVDNYDSFTYNLVQYLGELGSHLQVRRNDQITIPEIRQLNPDRIVISPGPGRPHEAGISVAIVSAFAGKVPILGVCLGHQAIAEAFGADIVCAPKLKHGKTSQINHSGQAILRGIPSPFEATRYHSLIVRRESLPECLTVTAWTREGLIMGLQHRDYSVWGLQFHPESVLTQPGMTILKNFLCCRD